MDIEDQGSEQEEGFSQLSMRFKMTVSFTLYFAAFALFVGGLTPEALDAWQEFLEHSDREGPLYAPTILTLGVITGAAYSPTGEFIAVSTGSGLMVYRASDKSVHLDLRDLGCPIHEMSWSPDASKIAGLCKLGPDSLHVWDIQTGQQLFSFNHSFTYWEGQDVLAWSPDSLLIAMPMLGAAGVWEASTGRALLGLETPANLTLLSWSPQARYLAGATEEEILVWDLEERTIRRFRQEEFSWFSRLGFSPEGGFLAATCYTNEILILNSSAEVVRTIRYGEDPYTITNQFAWSPDASLIAISGDYVDPQRAIALYSWEHGELTYLDGFEACGASSIVWAPRSEQFAVAGWDRVLYLYDREGHLLSKSQPFSENINSIHWHPTEARVLCRGTHLAECTPEGETVSVIEGYSASVHQVSWSPEEPLVASAGMSTGITIWNASSGERHMELNGAPIWVDRVSWTSQSSLIAAKWEGERVAVWNITTGKIQFNISQGSSCLASSPVKPLVAISEYQYAGGMLAVYNLSDGLLLWDHQILPVSRSLEWSPDGSLLASLSKDYDGPMVKTEIEVLTSDGEVAWLARPPSGEDLSWSPNGSILAVVGGDLLTLYDHAGEISARAQLDDEECRSVEWLPDGTGIVTAYGDGRVGIWNSTGLELLMVHRIHSYGIRDLRRSPSLDLVASVGSDGVIAFHTTSQLLSEVSTPATVPIYETSEFAPAEDIPLAQESQQPPLPSREEPIIGSLNIEVLWRLDLHPRLDQTHQSSPTVADIDADGRNEILLAYRATGCPEESENRLVCVAADGTVKWIFPRIDAPDMTGQPMTTPTLVDFNDDGKMEILIGNRMGAVHCIDSEGREIWSYTMDGDLGSVTAEPQLYDNDQDGSLEVFVASPYWICALDQDGGLLWKIKTGDRGAVGYAEWPPLVWDIDQDGSGEIVACFNNNNIVCYDATTREKEWDLPIPGDGMLRTTPVAADVDRDSRYEVLVAGQNGNFYVLNENGEVEWIFETPTEGQLLFTFPVGDIDSDNNLEVAFMDNDLVYCLDLFERELEWTFAPMEADRYSNYNTFADVTGDGEVDVLVVAPMLYVLSNQGELQAYFDTSSLHHDKRAENGMWSGDLNADGKIEILVKFDGDGLYCLTTGAGYDPSKMLWPKSLKDLCNRPVVPLEG